ncbi:hypothetical protein LTR05_008066 [Lithohypha guttulata]|uniref:Uncharacterized protein n=1 Tax=Lithohypha guttulata TaxID=1690604 RepID=A0AAN7STT9_9EURO|nr:hypothetical protein LTR05_008066 [Lithohypha guttulata]
MGDNTCKQFTDFTAFEAYVGKLRDDFGNLNSTKMGDCKTEICSTLYSVGNSAVSGIGVIVGYFLEIGIAILLGLSLLVFQRLEKQRMVAASLQVTQAFADSAIALALSVELASSIMLIKRNFGLGADNFGALTEQIVGVVALLVMLPISTFCWQDLKDKRFELRLCVIALTFIMFLITFISRMLSRYSQGQIDTGPDPVLTHAEMDQIELLCMEGVRQLSTGEVLFMEFLSVGGSIWLACIIIGALIKACFGPSRNYGWAVARAVVDFVDSDSRMLALNLVALFSWSIPLCWALLSLRVIQRQFAEALGRTDGGQEWSFGQILAVVVFAPVLVEIWYQYLQRHDLVEALDVNRGGYSQCIGLKDSVRISGSSTSENP